MPSSQEFMELESEYGAHNYHPLPVVISKAEGVWVWNPEGEKFIDMLSSYSALNQGHRHPRILLAVKEQTEQLTLTSRAFFNDRLGPFLKRLCEFAGQEMALPMNTGAEGVETAIKLVRKWGYKKKGVEEGKAEIIVCENNFHGRTTTIVGFSSDLGSRDGFGPFTPGFNTIPYGDTNALREAINPNTVAFLMEPIQGEAGIIIPPEGYLKEIRDICTENNVLLVFDEIQTGFGRTGAPFAGDHEGVKPDVLIVGKALGGGIMPVSAALSSKEIMSVFTPGDHGSTFGGNPLGCAVGIAAIDVLVDEKLPERSKELGDYFLEQLKNIDSPKVKEVRGRGLFIAVEIKEEHGLARPLCERMIKMGVLCKETHEQTIRFAPPLVITKEDIDWAMERIEKVLTE